MPYLFTTESGSTYTIADGRITREGAPIDRVPRADQLDRVPVVLHTGMPTVGQTVLFATGITGRVRTSPVTEVLHYCPGCDTFGDLWFCQPTVMGGTERHERLAAFYLAAGHEDGDLLAIEASLT